MKRLMLFMLVLALVLAFAAPAMAGEWNNARGYIHGDDEAPLPGNSACAYNGQDEPDDHPDSVDNDDWLWGLTPAGGHVQAGGQFAAFMAKDQPVPGAMGDSEFGAPTLADDCNPVHGGGGEH